MKEFVVFGEQGFTLGFELAGIKRSINTDGKEVENLLQNTLENETIGILVIQDKTIKGIKPHFRKQVENSIDPIVVVLSEDDTAQESLHALIKKSIGVDLAQS